MELDISNLDKAEVLAALFNRSEPQGMGYLQFKPGDMTKERAAEILEQKRQRMANAYPGVPSDQVSLYFDYLEGRCMKVELGCATLNTKLYDRQYGEGAAAAVLATLTLIHPHQEA